MIVVIPTMYIDHLEFFFDNVNQIDLSSVDKVFIFNNSEKKYKTNFDKFYIFNLGRNIGVNAVWNFGLKIAEAMSLDLMFLNDDVYFKKDFFSKTQVALEVKYDFAVICPYSCKTKEDFDIGFKPDVKNRFSMMQRRNGWAFTINKNFLSKIPTIPSKMKIFFGDDWIFYFTSQLWVKDNENLIYHNVGKTMKKNRDLRALYREDKRIFTENIKKLGKQ